MSYLELFLEKNKVQTPYPNNQQNLQNTPITGNGGTSRYDITPTKPMKPSKPTELVVFYPADLYDPELVRRHVLIEPGLTQEQRENWLKYADAP